MWQNTFTQWDSKTKPLHADDFNRFEGNALHLYQYGGLSVEISAYVGMQQFRPYSDRFPIQILPIVIPAGRKLVLYAYDFHVESNESYLDYQIYARSQAMGSGTEFSSTEITGNPNHVLYDNSAGASDVLDILEVGFIYDSGYDAYDGINAIFGMVK